MYLVVNGYTREIFIHGNSMINIAKYNIILFVCILVILKQKNSIFNV